MPTKNAKSLSPIYRGDSKLLQCSEVEDITIPLSKFSQSIKDSWFVSFSVHVATTILKSLTHLYRGDSQTWAR